LREGIFFPKTPTKRGDWGKEEKGIRPAEMRAHRPDRVLRIGVKTLEDATSAALEN